LSEIPIFGRNSDIWPKFRFLAEIPFLAEITTFFSRNSDFGPKFQFLSEIPIFGRNSDIWPKFRYLAEILSFGRNSDFAQNLELLRYNCMFSCYYFSTCGNSRTIPKKKFPKTKNILHLSIYFLAAFSD